MSGSWGAELIGSGTTGGTASGSLVDCPGGLCVMTAVASAWNASTLTLEMLGPDGATMLPCGAATTLTANGVGLVYLPPCQIQGVVSGGTPTGLFVSIARVVG